MGNCSLMRNHLKNQRPNCILQSRDYGSPLAGGNVERKGQMPFKYLVQCWVRPRSGFELARKNRVIKIIKEAMTDTFKESELIEKLVKQFEETHDGLIPEPFFAETDSEVTDPEREIMPEIWKDYPEAIFIKYEPISDFVDHLKNHDK